MPHCVLWTVSLKLECSDELELQNVHLNEITQFDFAEVIRQVNPISPLHCSDGLVDPGNATVTSRLSYAGSE